MRRWGKGSFKIHPPMFLAALVFGFTPILSINPSAAAPKVLKLLWAEEFNGKKESKPNPKTWSYDIGGGGWGNSELEYYTDKASNVALDGKGNLIINALRISDYSFNQLDPSNDTTAILRKCAECQFTSGKLKTAKKISFQYGRLEARLKVPAGAGTWPAFWLLGTDLIKGNPWPECGEIDIIELRGDSPNVAFATVHGPGYSGGAGKMSTIQLNESLAENFHTYAIEWKKNKIDFFVDDTLYHSVTPKSVAPNRWVFNQQFFIILNLAMGGEFTGEIAPEIKQAQLAIDYIRFYQLNSLGKVFKEF